MNTDYSLVRRPCGISDDRHVWVEAPYVNERYNHNKNIKQYFTIRQDTYHNCTEAEEKNCLNKPARKAWMGGLASLLRYDYSPSYKLCKHIGQLTLSTVR